ncbi:energy transducer TonB [Balneatrix alpica]|nr:energy transducer TonB [Balneatrix alpica]
MASSWASLSQQRFSYALAIALLTHGAIILGVAIAPPEPTQVRQNTLEVTLAVYQSQQAPEQADFIAQHDQQGSGDQEDKTRLSTLEKADLADRRIQELAAREVAPSHPQPLVDEPILAEPSTTPSPEPPQPEPKQAAPAVKQVVAKEAKSQVKEAAKPTPSKPAKQAPPPAPASGPSLMARSLEIASLEASLDIMRQEYAKRPRKRTLDANSTKRSEDAFYLNAWKDKIQQVGNLHYPQAARQQGLYGKLRLLVVLRPDGSVKEIQLLQSSGHPLLDDAARQIVRLASPFAPFPPQMKNEVDELEIIRTWVFEKNRTLY